MTEEVIQLAAELGRLTGAERHRRLRLVVDTLPLAQRFRLLHHLGIYRDRESFSGAASSMRESAALRAALPPLMAHRGIKRVLDIPCGDVHWMQHVTVGDYIGADIVPEIVSMNERRFKGSGRQFMVLDATTDPLPCVDLVLCRDLLIHLSLDDARAALANIVASGSRFFLTNHFTGRAENPEIVSGEFRPVNLCARPFSWPPPLEIISEESALGDGAFTDRAMALWRLADIG